MNHMNEQLTGNPNPSHGDTGYLHLHWFAALQRTLVKTFPHFYGQGTGRRSRDTHPGAGMADATPRYKNKSYMITSMRIRGSVQIMATGVFLIGLTNLLAYLFPMDFLTASSPRGIEMALSTAISLIMTGACLLLISYSPKVKTEYRKEGEL
tara:strand:- start:144 stop:599 length:456 start_codon:yes stop_codon:yes gene_type:complete